MTRTIGCWKHVGRAIRVVSASNSRELTGGFERRGSSADDADEEQGQGEEGGRETDTHYER